MIKGVHRLRMRNMKDVFFWTSVCVFIAMATTALIGWLLLPEDVFAVAIPVMATIAFLLGSSMALFACRQIMHLQLPHKTIKLLHATDALTGATTRRRFFELQAEMNVKQAAVMMVDVDHFKSINDRFGHPVGDEVLVQIAATLMETVRDRDIVARMGGEEFLVYLPDVNRDRAGEFATRLCSEVSRLRFVVGDDRLSVSVSIGLSEHTTDSPIDFAISAADRALYRAKEDGRNRWREEIPSDGFEEASGHDDWGLGSTRNAI